MAARKKKPQVDVEIINGLLRRGEELVQAGAGLLLASRAEMERIAGEAKANEDSDAVKKAVEETKLKKLEAEREEYDARIQRAQLEKKRLAAQMNTPDRSQNQNQQRHHKPNHPRAPYQPQEKSEQQRRIEQRREPLKSHIKGLETIDKESLPAAPAVQEAASK